MSARTGGGGANSSNSNRRGNGVEKPWASGRILTPEQRARKQEADRKANRFLKKEVQDRLSLLESRVEGLEKTKEENVVVVKQSPGSNGEAGGNGSMEWSVPDRSVNQGNGHAERDSSQYGADGTARSGSQHENYSPRAQESGDNELVTVDSHEALRKAVTPDFTDVSSIARTRSEGRHMTCFLNNLVNYIRTLPPAAVCFEDQYNQDLVITAVLKGWDYTLSRYGQRCPLWDVLRLVDMYLFRDANMLERIGCLRMLHKRYLFEVNANIPAAGPPPPWYRPQFCEKVFFHDPVIDHLTWPSLRDRLVQSEKDRLTNKFWVLFVRNLRVTWRHEPIDMMSFSQQNQLYFLTPVFETALLDINNWRMDMDFFRGIPQLAGDVPPYNYMPLRTHSPKFGNQGKEQAQHQNQNSAQSQAQVQTQTPVQTPIHTLPPQQPAASRYSIRPDSVQQQQPHQPPPPQPPPQQHQQQHPPQMPDMVAQDSWMMRPNLTFLENAPHLDMTKFTPTGTWQEFYG